MDDQTYFVEEVPIAPIKGAMDIAFSFKNKSKAELRLQQHQFIYTCYEGISYKKDVVIEGPTGLGKTRSLLAAVIPFLQQNKNNKVVYLTRTITQVHNIIDEIREITSCSSEGRKVLSACAFFGVKRLIEATGCFKPVDTNDGAYCGNCTKMRDYRYTHSNLPLHQVNGMEELLEHSSNQCPVSLMEANAIASRIVVAPHGYIFDQSWKNRYIGNVKNAVVILDEAHNFLSDASNEAYLTLNYGSESSVEDNRTANVFHYKQLIGNKQRQAERLHDRIPHAGKYKELLHVADNLFNSTVEIVKNSKDKTSIQESSGFIIEDCLSFSELANQRLSSAIKQCRAQARSMTKQEKARNGFIDTAYSVLQVVDALDAIIASPYDFFIDHSFSSIKFTAIHPRLKTNQALGGFHARVFTSATISPVDDVASLLGKPNALRTGIDHIFPEENYQHYYIAGVHSSRGSAEGSNDHVFSRNESQVLESVLSTCLEAANGKNIGVFFSSFEVLNQVARLIKENNIGAEKNTIFVGKTGGKGDLAKGISSWLHSGLKHVCSLTGHTYSPNIADTEMIELFMAMGDRSETTVLLGVQGGTLSEGIDYRGNAMEMVINIGLPYPSAASELQKAQIKKDYWGMLYDADGSVNIDDLSFKQEAFRKLAQSVGRAHRSTSDRAVVVFVDERLLAIKNDGGKSYEFMSSRNAKRNIKLLQHPVQGLSKNIVLDKGNPYFRPILKQLNTRSQTGLRGMGVQEDDLIDLHQMKSEIISFYGADSAPRQLLPDLSSSGRVKGLFNRLIGSK